VTPLAQQILAGKRKAIARQISNIENNHPNAQTVLTELYPHTGQAHLVGVTGPPGSGKSTLVNQLARQYRQQQKTVAVLAVDPTSPFTGGAILGDRIRLKDLAGDPAVFVRSMATRGHLGGLAQATSDAIKVFDAAGFELILIETVGVGQAEVEIAGLAHSVVVVDVPGLGDDVQAIKAGILEIADIFVINKADHAGADKTVAHLKAMLDLSDPHSTATPMLHHGQLIEVATRTRPKTNDDGWRPPIYKTVATQGDGIEAVVAGLTQHRAHQLASNRLQQRERHRLLFEIEHRLKTALLAGLISEVSPKKLEQIIEQVSARQLDPYTAVDNLLALGGCPPKTNLSPKK